MSVRDRCLLLWTPRVLAILYMAFISLFALDAWGTGAGFWRELAGFLIHLLPTFFLLAALLIAWVKPRAGGMLFVLLGMGMGVVFGWRDVTGLLLVAVFPTLIGLLFIVDGSIERGTLRPRC